MQHDADRTGGGCPFNAAGTPAVSRRRVLAGAGLAALAALTGLGGTAAGATPGTRRAPLPGRPRRARRGVRGGHAQGDPRGSDIAVRVGRDKEARFGLMFKQLPAFLPPDALLLGLARQMVDPTPPVSDVKDSQDGFNNLAMPAGYIYLGQFIDHDMTRDTTPIEVARSDPRALVNYDTPRFDLGSMYGNGPIANPELYDPAAPGKLLLVQRDGVVDLPRDEVGAAFLGDPRNDENLIIAQLHTAFMRLHNRFVDDGRSFAQAQELTRWHYQWVIVNDFLPRMVGRDLVDRLLSRPARGPARFLGRHYRPRNPKRPYMPVEYSGAAYRFGHSMIRAEYEVHDARTVPIFAPDGHEDLRGSRPIPPSLAVDWNYFFDIPGLSRPDDRNMARLIDTKLSLPLSTLPSTVVTPAVGAITALAERNLLRGKRLGLPAGQDVARAMGVAPLTNARLGLTDPGWGGKAPLWFYILKEAELGGGHTLGPVGGGIVAEVILGLLAADRTSYLNGSGFTPVIPHFGMGELLTLAGAVDPRFRPAEPEPAEPAHPEALPEPAGPTV
ncbi:peroxidase [Pseudonocardia sp. C8]|uniref:peroxidase family protein n=1 Tax=Pseudonocardia sp. C8 TaxID=2762759 RepID=UPI001642C68B|nr:heme peroxidase family protein [Pseudonocardia sp. C8]MBC3194307.1 peroxidase [Pseudonocardia sp. C8]